MPEPTPIRPVSSAAPSAEPSFADFWRIYPRKINRALCQAKWHAITNGGLATRMMDRTTGLYESIRLQASPDQIIAGARAFLAAWPRKPNSYDYLDPQFIPHPATWLNSGRWMDHETTT